MKPTPAPRVKTLHSQLTLAAESQAKAAVQPSPSFNRRKFVAAVAASAAGAAAWPGSSLPLLAASSPARASRRRLRIALLATEVRKYSHAQHFVDRFTEGYGWQG